MWWVDLCLPEDLCRRMFSSTAVWPLLIHEPVDLHVSVSSHVCKTQILDKDRSTLHIKGFAVHLWHIWKMYSGNTQRTQSWSLELKRRAATCNYFLYWPIFGLFPQLKFQYVGCSGIYCCCWGRKKTWKFLSRASVWFVHEWLCCSHASLSAVTETWNAGGHANFLPTPDRVKDIWKGEGSKRLKRVKAVSLAFILVIIHWRKHNCEHENFEVH